MCLVVGQFNWRWKICFLLSSWEALLPNMATQFSLAGWLAQFHLLKMRWVWARASLPRVKDWQLRIDTALFSTLSRCKGRDRNELRVMGFPVTLSTNHLGVLKISQAFCTDLSWLLPFGRVVGKKWCRNHKNCFLSNSWLKHLHFWVKFSQAMLFSNIFKCMCNCTVDV